MKIVDAKLLGDDTILPLENGSPFEEIFNKAIFLFQESGIFYHLH